MYWVENDETIVAYAAGSTAGVVRRGKICTIQKTAKIQTEKKTKLVHSLGTADSNTFSGAKEIASLSSEKALLETSTDETCEPKPLALSLK